MNHKPELAHFYAYAPIITYIHVLTLLQALELSSATFNIAATENFDIAIKGSSMSVEGIAPIDRTSSFKSHMAQIYGVDSDRHVV
jgi:hypothetical protein